MRGSREGVGKGGGAWSHSPGICKDKKIIYDGLLEKWVDCPLEEVLDPSRIVHQ